MKKEFTFEDFKSEFRKIKLQEMLKLKKDLKLLKSEGYNIDDRRNILNQPHLLVPLYNV